MIGLNKISAQSSFDLYGNVQNAGNSRFRLNSYEANPNNFNNTKDWELSFIYGGEFSNTVTSNVYLISLAKRFDDHYFYARFTPGIQKDFIFKTGTSIILPDSNSVETELETQLHYEEKFGMGYSFNFTSNFSAGFNLRYFKQEFSQEVPDPFFSDSINFITTATQTSANNYWRGDLGFNYIPFNKLSLSLSSINLMVLNESASGILPDSYNLRTDKSAIIGIDYNPVKLFNINGRFETTSSFITGFNLGFDFAGGKFTIGASVLHDKYQQPFIAGIIPSINYSSDIFSITVSGVNYFSERNGANLLSDFLKDGLHNIINNRYSSSKIFASVNFALSFVPDNYVKFIDVKINDEIYPTMSDEYINKPFAVGKVANISERKVSVKPSSFIPAVNDDRIYSPAITILPHDTVLIPFYTIIDDNKQLPDKREISTADFYLITLNSNPDDYTQRPILINDKNAWDGRVSSLKYFVKDDYNFSQEHSKDILRNYKVLLDTVPLALANFERVKILFNNFVKSMIYVSDPRATVERVQFPNETFKIKGGDCDDLSVFFGSMLQSIGIQTAFVDFKAEDGVSHVNLLVNTGLTPEQAPLITVNDKKYFIRKNVTGHEEVWIPLETTSLSDFNTAWQTAAEKFHIEAVNKLGLSKGNVEIIDIY